MNKIIALIFATALMIGCEYPIREINEWWRHDVLKHTEEEEPATAAVGFNWPEE